MSKGAVDRLREMREEKAAREEARQKADRVTLAATIKKLRGDVAKTAAKKAKPKKGKKK